MDFKRIKSYTKMVWRNIKFMYSSSLIDKTVKILRQVIFTKIEILYLKQANKQTLELKDLEIISDVLYEITYLKRGKGKIILNESDSNISTKIKNKLLEDDSSTKILSDLFSLFKFNLKDKLVYINNNASKEEIEKENFYHKFDKRHKEVEEFSKRLKIELIEIKKLDEVKRIKSESKTKLKKLRTVKTNLQTLKINISKETIITFISIFSTIFFASGYLYNALYYSFFCIDITPFFKLEDYLSTSISTIGSVFLSSLLGIVLIYLQVNYHITKYPVFNEEKEKKKSFLKVIWNKTLIVLFISMFLFQYIHNSRVDIISLTLLYFSVVYPISLKVAERFFNLKRSNLFLVLFLTSYLGIFANNIASNIQNYKTKYDNYNVDIGISNENNIIIGLNSNYIIYQDTITESVNIYPSNRIKKIDIKKKHETSFIDLNIMMFKSIKDLMINNK